MMPRKKDKMPIPRELLFGLFEYLDGPDELTCDCTLQHTIDFLIDHDLDPEVCIPWLEDHGGFCDCEVLFNVEPKFW